MKVIVLLASLFTATLIIVIFLHGKPLPLNAAKIRVVQKSDGVTTHLQITGLVFASASAIRKIDAIQKGDSIIVKVYTVSVYLHGGLSGAIDYDLVVKPNINRVSFGKEADVIWQRYPKSS